MPEKDSAGRSEEQGLFDLLGRSGTGELPRTIGGLDRRRYLKLAGLLGATGLAGCAEGPGGDGGDGNATDTGTETGTGTGTSTETAGTDGGTDELKIWSWTRNFKDVHQQQGATFEQQTDGTSVSWQFYPYSQYITKLTSAIAGGKGPKTFTVAINWVAQLADQNVTRNLEETDVEIPELTDGARRNATFDGNLVAVPWYGDCRLMILNKDWFKKEGVALPEDPHKPPTWDQFASWVNQLGGDSKSISMKSVEAFHALLFSNGGRILRKTDSGYECVFDSDEVIATANYVVEDLGLDNILFSGDELEEFVSENVPIIYGGSWEYGDLNDSGIDWTYVPIPKGPSGDSSHSTSAGVFYSITSDAPAASKKWLEFILSKDQQLNVVEQVGGFPGRADVYETEAFQSIVEGDENLQIIAEQMPNAIGRHQFPEYGEIQSEHISPAIERVWQEKATPEEAFPTACKNAQPKLP